MTTESPANNITKMAPRLTVHFLLMAKSSSCDIILFVETILFEFRIIYSTESLNCLICK